MVSASTCETKPSVLMPFRSGSAFMPAIAVIGFIFRLFRSKMTREGRFSRIRGTTISGDRSKNRSIPPMDFAAVWILIEKIRSSMTHRIMLEEAGLHVGVDAGRGRRPVIRYSNDSRDARGRAV